MGSPAPRTPKPEDDDPLGTPVLLVAAMEFPGSGTLSARGANSAQGDYGLMLGVQALVVRGVNLKVEYGGFFMKPGRFRQELFPGFFVLSYWLP